MLLFSYVQLFATNNISFSTKCSEINPSTADAAYIFGFSFFYRHIKYHPPFKHVNDKN